MEYLKGTERSEEKGRLEAILSVLDALKIEGTTSKIILSYKTKVLASNSYVSVEGNMHSDCGDCGDGFCGPCSGDCSTPCGECGED